LFKSIKRFKNFDEITEFRLRNAFFVSIGIAILAPILVTLKGLYLAVYIVSIFLIISTLSVKSNEYMTKNFSISSLYKMGIFIHLSLIFISLIYFISPGLMVWLDSIAVILETIVFSSYSIVLNNYIAHHYPKSMQEFQVVRNSSWADGFLLGLLLVTLLTYFYSIGTALVVFVVLDSMFVVWTFKNYYFFDKFEQLKCLKGLE